MVNENHYSREYTDYVSAKEGSQLQLRYNPDNPERNDETVEVTRVRWLSAFAFAIGLVGFALYVWYQSRK
jgi:hypothetical protein